MLVQINGSPLHRRLSPIINLRIGRTDRLKVAMSYNILCLGCKFSQATVASDIQKLTILSVARFQMWTKENGDKQCPIQHRL